MPTPATIVDAAQTLGDAYVATAGIYDQVSLFVAFGVGLSIVVFIVGLVRRTARR